MISLLILYAHLDGVRENIEQQSDGHLDHMVRAMLDEIYCRGEGDVDPEELSLVRATDDGDQTLLFWNMDDGWLISKREQDILWAIFTDSLMEYLLQADTHLTPSIMWEKIHLLTAAMNRSSVELSDEMLSMCTEYLPRHHPAWGSISNQRG